MDHSNGYEGIAQRFLRVRGSTRQGVGTATVRAWARTLSPGATVLDLGCGTGLPLARVLLDEGLTVYGLDASPTLVQAFRQHFPTSPVRCETVEQSRFFARQFDAIIAWGLLFLLPEPAQVLVLQQAASALPPGGKLLFTAPAQPVAWPDALTGQASRSLGAAAYSAVLAAAGVVLLAEFDDEGANHYFSAVKA